MHLVSLQSLEEVCQVCQRAADCHDYDVSIDGFTSRSPREQVDAVWLVDVAWAPCLATVDPRQNDRQMVNSLDLLKRLPSQASARHT